MLLLLTEDRLSNVFFLLFDHIFCLFFFLLSLSVPGKVESIDKFEELLVVRFYEVVESFQDVVIHQRRGTALRLAQALIPKIFIFLLEKVPRSPFLSFFLFLGPSWNNKKVRTSLLYVECRRHPQQAAYTSLRPTQFSYYN